MLIQEASHDMMSKEKRNLYYRSLLRFCGHPEQFKNQIKELLPYIYLQESELLAPLQAYYCLCGMVGHCNDIDVCEELIDAVDLKHKKPLLYPMLLALCHKPERFSRLIKKLAPLAYEEQNEYAFKETARSIWQLISSSKEENNCQELVKAFPWDKASFELSSDPQPLLHLLIEKNYKNIIRCLSNKINIQAIDVFGKNALHKAAFGKKDAEMIQLVLDLGVSPLARTKHKEKHLNNKLARDFLSPEQHKEAYELLLAAEKKAQEGASSSPLRECNYSSNLWKQTRRQSPGAENHFERPTLLHH